MEGASTLEQASAGVQRLSPAHRCRHRCRCWRRPPSAAAPCCLQIEADLRFCEDVLKSAARPPARQASPAGAAGVAAPTQPKQAGGHAAARTPRKQAPAPLRVPGGQHPAAALAARTTEELLDLLSSVPDGQPFEIDTRLLYSPQSSYVASGQNSPGGRSACHEASMADWAAQQHGGGGGEQFLLPAYRPTTHGQQPLFADIGQAAVALSPLSGGPPSPWRSQQHAAGPLAGEQQEGQRASTSRPPARSPARSEGSRSAASARPGSAPSRQLRLDDAQGVQGSTAALLRRGREDRIEQLAQPRTQLWQRCAQIRVQEERAELQVGR